MQSKSVGLQILWWSEVIVSARVLLFTAPVLINKSMAETFSSANASDWYLLVLTLGGLSYMLVGIASLIGHKMWKIFHFIVAAVVLCLSGALINLAMKSEAMSTSFYMPAIFAILLTVLIVVTSGKQSANN